MIDENQVFGIPFLLIRYSWPPKMNSTLPSFSFVCSLLLFLSFISTAFTSTEKLNDDPLIRQVVSSNGHGSSDQASRVPCYFVFGDSLFDNGNNNDLPTTAKANYLPYGIDFPEGPTGRFTNNRNSADVLAELLGFDDYIPPFARAKGIEIFKGVNYASGGAGILDISGYQLGARISLDRQLLHHQITVSQIVKILGEDKISTADYLKKCLYTVGMGNNDYLNNYFMPQFYPSSFLFTPEEFADILIRKYSQQLKTLYKMGARKVAVFGLGAIGCTLYEVANYGATDGSICVEFINSAVELFGSKIVSLVDDFNLNLPNATFAYVNSSGIALTPAPPELKVKDISCCEVTNDTTACIRLSTPCAHRNEYVFWDEVHPTDAATVRLVGRAYNALLPSDTYPIDIKTLVQL